MRAMPATAQHAPGEVQNIRRAALYHFIFFLSGIAGLGYELVWARMLSIGLGHEMPAVLAVVAAFFGGTALGAWLLDGVVSRTPRPARWYAALEAVIGAWGVVLLLLLPWCNRVAVQLIGIEPSPSRQWMVAFFLPLIALLPATMAMGATLPAMERAVSRLFASTKSGHVRVVGGLYAANTAGALTGVLATTFLIVPAFGFRVAILTLVVINFLCAMLMIVLGPFYKLPDIVRTPITKRAAPLATDSLINPRRLALTVFATGLLGIGYEVIGVRIMGLALENTVYSFASALAIFLLGTAIGAAIYQRFASAAPVHTTLTLLLTAVATACAIGVHIMSHSIELYERLREALGRGQMGSIAAEMVLAALVFGFPTLCMGAIFSHLVQAARHEDGGVGQAVAINTFGGALAPVTFGVWALPNLGANTTLFIIAAGYLVLVSRWFKLAAALALIPIVLLLLPINLRLVQPPANGKVREYRDGVMAAVAVVEDNNHARFLKVNNRFMMGGTPTTFLERRLGHIPLLLHPEPRRALFLGVGTGVSLGAAVNHEGLHTDAAELIPEVVEVLSHFEPENRAPHEQPNIHLFVADARRFVLASNEQYDAIVGDLFHPARDGAGSLYTLEHFTAVRERLAPGGVLCQWLPLYQLDEPMLRVIVRTFMQVFPDAHAFLGSYNANTPTLGLIGGTVPLRFGPEWFNQRVRTSALLQELQTNDLGDIFRLFGGFVADRNQLREFAGNGPLNTDNYPVVIFNAPRLAYAEDEPVYGRLQMMLDRPLPDVATLITDQEQTLEFRDRLRRYIEARNVFLRGMIATLQQRESHAIEMYIESARRSEDFTPGYVVCLALAQQKHREQPETARQILQQLIEIRPTDPRAATMRRQLFGR